MPRPPTSSTSPCPRRQDLHQLASAGDGVQPRPSARGDCRRHPRPGVHRLPRPPVVVGRCHGPDPATGQRARRRRPRRSARRTSRTRGPRVARRSSRHLLLQRQRVPRGDDRRVQGAPRSGERQLPLRRRGAALPPRQQPGQGDRVPLAVRADAGRGAARSAAAHGVAPGGRRLRQRPAARRAVVRRRARGRITRSSGVRRSGRPTTSTSSTPAARPACRRACCGVSTTSSCR